MIVKFKVKLAESDHKGADVVLEGDRMLVEMAKQAIIDAVKGYSKEAVIE